MPKSNFAAFVEHPVFKVIAILATITTVILGVRTLWLAASPPSIIWAVALPIGIAVIASGYTAYYLYDRRTKSPESAQLQQLQQFQQFGRGQLAKAISEAPTTDALE